MEGDCICLHCRAQSQCVRRRKAAEVQNLFPSMCIKANCAGKQAQSSRLEPEKLKQLQVSWSVGQGSYINAVVSLSWCQTIQPSEDLAESPHNRNQNSSADTAKFLIGRRSLLLMQRRGSYGYQIIIFHPGPSTAQQQQQQANCRLRTATLDFGLLICCWTFKTTNTWPG